MNKERYNSLNQEELNLAKYFEALKINSDLTNLSKEELTNIKKEYMPSLDDKLGDIDLKIKISQKLRDDFIVTENIKAIENISLRIAYLLYRKNAKSIENGKILKLDTLKYGIMKLLLNDDSVLRLLKTNINSKIIKQASDKVILENISIKIGASINISKIDARDIERLDKLVDSFKNNEAIKSNLTTNTCIYNLVNATGTNVKKLAKRM